MKKISHLSPQISLGFVAIFLLGCLSAKTDLLKSGTVAVEPVASNNVTFSRFSVHVDDQVLVIYGKVGRAPGVSGRLEGNVHVMLIDSNGNSLAEECTYTFPKRIPIRRSRRSHFVVRLPRTQGLEIVRVHYHLDEHSSERPPETTEKKF